MPHQQRAGVLLRFQDEILIVLSPEGKWSIPKGSVKSRETLLECAQREFREETGLVVDLSGAKRMNVPNCKVFLLHTIEKHAIDMASVTTKHEVVEVGWKHILDPDVYARGNAGLKKYLDTAKRALEQEKESKEGKERRMRRRKRWSLEGARCADDILRTLENMRHALMEVEGFVRSVWDEK